MVGRGRNGLDDPRPSPRAMRDEDGQVEACQGGGVDLVLAVVAAASPPDGCRPVLFAGGVGFLLPTEGRGEKYWVGSHGQQQ